MQFSSVIFFSIPPIDVEDDSFENALRNRALKPLGPLDRCARGFISPFGSSSQSFIHVIGECVLFTVGGHDKVLPAAAVNAVVDAKLDAIEQKTGERPKGKAKARIKDDTLQELLPKALVKPFRCHAYIDKKRGFLAVGNGSMATAEAVVSAVRAALGSFGAIRIMSEGNPAMVFTDWVRNGSLPNGMLLGDECEIKELVEGGAVAKLQRYDLPSDEVEQQIRHGKHCTKVAVSHEAAVSFVIDSTLVLRKVKLDSGKIEPIHDPASNPAAELDARFALISSEFGLIFDKLSQALSFRVIE